MISSGQVVRTLRLGEVKGRALTPLPSWHWCPLPSAVRLNQGSLEVRPDPFAYVFLVLLNE